MGKIIVLDEKLINKIAAGEVVERPASVVKELIENSLDAGATKVTVEVRNSGRDLLRVSDNGEGMDEEDARKCLQRHATSKITTDKDLFNIATLGFRGEALSSIGAVSQLSLITKRADALGAFHIVLEGGKEISSGILAGDKGTSIEIRNLFFNTPARRKFLKTDAVELRHIIDLVTRYAIINPEISMSLKHDNHLLIQSPASSSWVDSIASIYGSETAKSLLEVNYTGSIKITGFISQPYHVRNDKQQQSFFANSRWFKSDEIGKAIYEGYRSLLFVNKHPTIILNLDLEPHKIDVNVHPNKLTVKFDQPELVCHEVTAAIQQTLQQNNLIPVVDVEEQLAISPIQAKYNFASDTQQVLESAPAAPPKISVPSFTQASKVLSLEKVQTPVALSHQKAGPFQALPMFKLLGQIHKTFFVAETEGGILFIDQHAAHERVLYETFMEQFVNENVAVQKLLQPEIVEFSTADRVITQANLESLEKLGFKVSHFGGNTFRVHTVPSIFGKTQSTQVLQEIVGHLHEGTLQKMKVEIVTRMACRSAVMAGQELSNAQMQNILDGLSTKKLPFTCPHGRPTIIKTESEELEKKFRRK